MKNVPSKSITCAYKEHTKYELTLNSATETDDDNKNLPVVVPASQHIPSKRPLNVLARNPWDG